MKRVLFAVLLVGLVAGNAGALTVDVTATAEQMVAALLGSGVSVVPGSVSYTGAGIASGLFSGGLPSGIGISQGVVLTSGNANYAANANNTQGDISGNNGLAGDTALNGLVPGYSTYDATVLEFDFVTAGGDLFFNFVFASEEYNEWVGSSFNDVFGFFVNGVNIGVIPGTAVPVSVNTVNLGSYASYYNNNANSPYPYPFEYDGFTTVFTASALELGAGTHHMKLAIADAGDRILDSAVFLQAGTFSDIPTPPQGVPDPASTLGLLGMSLFALKACGRRLRK